MPDRIRYRLRKQRLAYRFQSRRTGAGRHLFHAVPGRMQQGKKSRQLHARFDLFGVCGVLGLGQERFEHSPKKRTRIVLRLPAAACKDCNRATKRLAQFTMDWLGPVTDPARMLEKHGCRRTRGGRVWPKRKRWFRPVHSVRTSGGAAAALRTGRGRQRQRRRETAGLRRGGSWCGHRVGVGCAGGRLARLCGRVQSMPDRFHMVSCSRFRVAKASCGMTVCVKYGLQRKIPATDRHFPAGRIRQHAPVQKAPAPTNHACRHADLPCRTCLHFVCMLCVKRDFARGDATSSLGTSGLPSVHGAEAFSSAARRRPGPAYAVRHQRPELKQSHG